jgi:hypothetical protein
VSPQELIRDCTTWHTVSWIKIKYLEYEKAIQIFSFIDVTILTMGLAMPDIQNWRKCAKTVIHHERKEANKHLCETRPCSPLQDK